MVRQFLVFREEWFGISEGRGKKSKKREAIEKKKKGKSYWSEKNRVLRL